MPTNRKVAILGGLITLALALLPVIADLDWRSTAGVIAGVIAVLKIVDRFLEGWSNWEVAETKAQTAVVTAAAAGAQVPGLSEGVKAESYQPPAEESWPEGSGPTGT